MRSAALGVWERKKKDSPRRQKKNVGVIDGHKEKRNCLLSPAVLAFLHPLLSLLLQVLAVLVIHKSRTGLSSEALQNGEEQEISVMALGWHSSDCTVVIELHWYLVTLASTDGTQVMALDIQRRHLNCGIL